MPKAMGEKMLYAGQINIKVIESAANTLTFQKVESGVSVGDRIGWVLNRVAFRLGYNALAAMDAAGDYIKLALTMSNSITAITDDDPAVIYTRQLSRIAFGTAATGGIVEGLFEADFSTLPGGGLLILPNPLYFAVAGSGCTGAITSYCRAFFMPITMNDADYFNLVQSRQVLINS